MLVVYVSFALRKRIGIRNWRWVRRTTYGGVRRDHRLPSDGWIRRGRVAGDRAYLGAIGRVAAATTWRALMRPPDPPRP
jgi:hypothetical protein